jgi:hypothetical protein
VGIYRVTQEERLTIIRKWLEEAFRWFRQMPSGQISSPRPGFLHEQRMAEKHMAVCGWDDQPCYTGDVASNPTFATNKRPTSTTSIKPEVWKALPATYLIYRQNDKIYRNSSSVNSLQLAAQYLRFSWKPGAVPGPGATHSHWLFGGHGSSVLLI